MKKESKTEDIIRKGLSQMGKQDSLFESLYRQVAVCFGLSSCEMWIYYFLLMEEKLTQQEICERIMYPLQTINSAVRKLEKNGFVSLAIDKDNHRSKFVLLTKKGKTFANKTARLLLLSEIRATQMLGEKKMKKYIQLRGEYFSLLEGEFKKNFLTKK